jgi:DNA polymerase-3 subunit beta
MNLTVKKSDLFAILSKASSVTENRATMPILASVLLDAQGDTLTVSAYDLEVAYVGLVGATVTKPGKMAVSAKALGDVVRSLPEEVVELRQDKTKLVITSGSAEFRLATSKVEDFPALPEGVAGVGITVDGSVFAKLLSKVGYCQSTDETRYALNSTYLEGKEGNLCATATDGHRLVHSVVSCATPDFGGVLVSRKTTGLLRRVLAAGEVHVEVSENSVSVTQGSEVIVARLVDGHFPDYAAIYPKTEAKSTVDVKGLLSSLGRLKLVNEANTWKVAGGTVKFKATNPDLGEVEDWIHHGGDTADSTFGVNGAYIREAVSVVTGGSVDVFFPQDDLTPLVLRYPGLSEGLEDYAIVMPMRVK